MVTFAAIRSGAVRRLCAKSNGLAIAATDATGSVSSPATASSDMIPPRHQPTSWTGRPPASSLTVRIALGSTSRTQYSSPRSRSENAIEPYSTRYVGWPIAMKCSAIEQPRRRSKLIVGAASGGMNSTGRSCCGSSCCGR